MSTNVTWNGVAYTIPASGELNWPTLSAFLIALGTSAAVAEEMKQAMRVATTSPVTVSATTDFAVLSKLAAPGAVAVTLPAGVNGQIFVIGDQTGDAATNNITITPNGAETINGSATYVISDNRGSVILGYSTTNTQWNILARYVGGSILTNPMATTGDMIYGGAAGIPTKFATGATTGLAHGGNGAVPTWSLVVNADVSASAAIDFSKLAALTSTNILVGSAGNVATSTAVTGDVTIGNTGVTAIAAGVIVNADVNASAAIDGTKIVSASGATSGVVTGSAQAFTGLKTFNSGVQVNNSGQSTFSEFRQDTSTMASTRFDFNGSGGATNTNTVGIVVQRVGDWCTIFIPAVIGTARTSSSGFVSNVNVPSGYRPATNNARGFFANMTEAGSASTTPGFISIATTGAITILKTATSTPYANGAASCGMADLASFSYYVGTGS